MENNTYMSICGKGSINIDDGTFHGVLCVPSLASNLLSFINLHTMGQGILLSSYLSQYLSNPYKEERLL